MKVGAAAVGYTAGSLYKRFKTVGLMQSRNMKSMNRATVASYNAAVVSAGPQTFDTMTAASQSKSELVAEQVLLRVQAEMKAKSTSTSNLGALANIQT